MKQRASQKHRSNSRTFHKQKVKNTAGEEGYRVGPGRPPQEFQFKKGQSGNPRGRKRRPPIALEVSKIFHRLCSEKVMLRQGHQQRWIKKIEAGIAQLINQFATGDRYARRDFFWLATQLGIDLVPPTATALGNPPAAEQQAILRSFLERATGQASATRIIAPVDLLDDDPPEAGKE